MRADCVISIADRYSCRRHSLKSNLSPMMHEVWMCISAQLISHLLKSAVCSPTQKYTTQLYRTASTSWKGILTRSKASDHALGG